MATIAAAISAAGHTLIQVATARSTAAVAGRVASSGTPTIATATVIESTRPSATGPSSKRNASHHHPTVVSRRSRWNDRITMNATASTIITRVSQVGVNCSGPNTLAISIGTNATIGYTQTVSIPTQMS